MESLFNSILNAVPNIGVALLVLYWQKQTIDSLLANQTKLIDQLMTYVNQDRVRAQNVLAALPQSDSGKRDDAAR